MIQPMNISKPWFLPSKLFCLIFFCLSASTSWAQIQASVDTTHITIGEPINLEIRVDAEQDEKIIFPELKDTISYHIEILKNEIDTVKNKGKLTLVQRLQISSYDAGEFLVRSLPIVIDNDTLLSPSFKIQVEDVEIDSSNLIGFPIKPIMEEQFTLKDYWNQYWPYIIMATMLFLALLIVAILYLRRNKNKKKTEKIKSPYEEATDDLKALDKKKYVSESELNEYYSKLSYILRRYIGRVYKFSSLEMLSEDLTKFLKENKHLDSTELKELKQFLYDSDLVKFAKILPQEKKHEFYRKWVGEFVEKIKPLNLEEEMDYELKPNEKYREIR